MARHIRWIWGLAALILVGCVGAQTAVPLTAGTSTLDAVDRGRSLFRDKGCVSCHRNDRAGGETGLMPIGPDLSDYTNSDTDFLRRWLADPAAVRPGTQMIDLNLSEREIEDLIVFLNEAP